jgi:hypothetical protein
VVLDLIFGFWCERDLPISKILFFRSAYNLRSPQSSVWFWSVSAPDDSLLSFPSRVHWLFLLSTRSIEAHA